MNIAIACDHGGFLLKSALIPYIESMGHQIKDFGCYDTNSMDYADVAFPASEGVAKGTFDRGILICTTGIGMSVCANKVKGIRCALCCNELTARLTREHNDTNMLALGAEVVDEELAKKIVTIWLDTPFSQIERHARRIQKISNYECK